MIRGALSVGRRGAKRLSARHGSPRSRRRLTRSGRGGGRQGDMNPYYDHNGITIYHGDCREVLPHVSTDLLVTDPPYGFRKAEWDQRFTIDWLAQAATATKTAMAIMPGIANVLRLPQSIPPFEFRWMISIHITNGMTRGVMGFGNWIPILIYASPDQSLYRPQQDATAILIFGEPPQHPSPKPLRAMTWIVERLPIGSVLDPFMGSGTTLIAAKNLGREAVGIEIEERYCEIAAKRLAQEVLPL